MHGSNELEINLIRARAMISTVFKSESSQFYQVLQFYRTLYARNRAGILKTSRLVKCPHGRCVHNNFEAQVMRNRTKTYFRTMENIQESNLSKRVNIKPVQVHTHSDWFKSLDTCHCVDVNGFTYNNLFPILLLNYLLRHTYAKR